MLPFIRRFEGHSRAARFLERFHALVPCVGTPGWIGRARRAIQPCACGASAELNKLFEDYFEQSLELNPLQATFIGDHRYDDQLTNSISPAFIKKVEAFDKAFLAAALKFEARSLSDADRLSLDIFISERRRARAAAEFPGELLPVNQFQSLPALMPVLGSGESAQPFATTQDYERFLARMRDYLVWSDQAIANMREGMRRGYEVRAVEAFRTASAAGASYQPPSADGSRPGIFYVNTHNLKAQPKFGMETLSLHEAAPGHHFQVAIQQELEALPRFRRFGADYVAYIEGWALYAESIGKELGLFTDPYQYYGRLSDEMLRAMRLVVDTGMHTKGWTREQAIRYMLDNSAMAESDVIAEVERCIAIPGQALGYKIGQIRIRELRTKG